MQSAIAGNWLGEEIAFESQQLREAASADPFKPYSNEALDVPLAELATFARTRPAFVARQIDLLK